MSAEEDTELRDLLSQTLENNGSLAKIRAQLRACVFLALDEDDLIQKKQPLLNAKIKQHVSTPEGKLMFSLVREFLEFYNLDCTISVYEAETYSGTEYYYEGRSKLTQDLSLDVNDAVPLLVQLIRITRPNNNNQVVNGKCEERNEKNRSAAGLNETFDLSSPTIDKPETPRSDTYEGTSSIVEDGSVKENCLIDLDNSVRNSQAETPRSLLDDFSPPIVREGKKVSPQKQLKGMNHFPPLQNRGGEIKELLESDLLDNYEEDFMSGSEVDAKSDKSAINRGIMNLTEASVKENESVTSEDFELNSNVDDILNSNNS